MIFLKIGDKQWNSELSFKNAHKLEKVIYYLAFLWMLWLKIDDKQWISQWSFKIKKQLLFHVIIYFYDQCGYDKRIFLMIRRGKAGILWQLKRPGRKRSLSAGRHSMNWRKCNSFLWVWVYKDEKKRSWMIRSLFL